MNLPKKLQPCHRTNLFIVDENGKDMLLSYANAIDNNDFRKEVVNRYNRYNKLVIALSIVSLALAYSLATILTVLRFKL